MSRTVSQTCQKVRESKAKQIFTSELVQALLVYHAMIQIDAGQMFLTFLRLLTEIDKKSYRPDSHFSPYPCFRTNILFGELTERPHGLRG